LRQLERMATEQRKYDLTPAMAPFMDVHMVNSLLDHVREVRNGTNLFVRVPYLARIYLF
jgi:hypothetical protein